MKPNNVGMKTVMAIAAKPRGIFANPLRNAIALLAAVLLFGSTATTAGILDPVDQVLGPQPTSALDPVWPIFDGTPLGPAAQYAEAYVNGFSVGDLPLVDGALEYVDTNVIPVAGSETIQTGIVEIEAASSDPVVALPVLPGQGFDLAVEFPYLAAAGLGASPTATLAIDDQSGLAASYPGAINVVDNPDVTAVAGGVSVYFSDVAEADGHQYTLQLSWDSHNYTMNPYNAAALSIPTPADPYIEALRQHSSSSGTCTTYVGASVVNSGATVYTATGGSAAYVDLAKLNFRTDITWYGSCNTSGPGSYRAGTGYGADIRGYNSMASGGLGTLEVAAAHMGGGSGSGSPDGFGYKEINVMPQIRLLKPTENKIKLDSASVLGYNKASCTAWPSQLATALGAIPTTSAYAWSVLTSIYSKAYCSTNFEMKNSGSQGDYTAAGFKITKNSLSSQYEDGGRIVYRNSATGKFTLPLRYQEFFYGQVQPQGNPLVSFSGNTAELTTSTSPAAVVT